MNISRNTAFAIATAVAGFVIYKILTTPSASGTIGEQASNFLDNVQNAIVPGSWLKSGAAYIPTINQVEAQFGIPTNLLARVAYQESHWRADIINGQTLSTAGAVGMFQMLPRFFPGVGRGWQSDAQLAAAELARLYGVYGDWQLALAAYNDGQGNVSAQLAANGAADVFNSLPKETRDYVTDISGDTGVQGALVNV